MLARCVKVLLLTTIMFVPKAWGHGAGFLAVGTPGRVHQELVALFGAATAFSARANVTWTKPDGVRGQSFPIYYRKGALRLDRDHATNPFLPPSSKDLHRNQGTDVNVTLATADGIYTIFPRLEAVFVYAKEDVGENTIAKKDLSHDTIDGHPCRKRELVITDETGSTRLVVWEAEDLQGLPIRVEDDHGENTTRMDLVDVKPDPPASLFEVPAGYRRLNNDQELQAFMRDHKPTP
jgi:hypothetical protein